MTVKDSEDAIPLSDFETHAGHAVRYVTRARRPVLVTSRGRDTAIMQALVDFEAAEEERAFMRAVVKGLSDLEAGREVSLGEAKARLGLE